MIHELDHTIRALLLRDMNVSNLTISFDTPNAQFRPRIEPPAINLFLYDLRENRELRSNELIERHFPDGSRYPDKITRHPAPLRVDCSYLVTAWTGDGTATQLEDEHHLLSQAMLILAANPRLPASLLDGSLEGQSSSPPTATLQPGRLQSIGEFWQALGGNPKAAFDYTVTIEMALAKPAEQGQVKDVILKVADKHEPTDPESSDPGSVDPESDTFEPNIVATRQWAP
jgi:hypothetical protein